MKQEIASAVEELRLIFAGNQIEVIAEAQGGAYIIVHDVLLGDQYRPARSWLGALITFQYPYADVYPHFVEPGLARVDGRPLGEGFSGPTQWHDRPAIQVSRRSNRWDASTDSAALKFSKVLEWLRSR